MPNTGRKNTPGLHLPPTRSGRHLPPNQASVTPTELESLVRKSRELPDLRWDKVQAVRNAIRSGEYDVDGRLNELLENMSRAISRRDDRD